MAGQLRVGSPMWADRRWVGTLFPHATPAGEELGAYATWCTAVEGNTTFYALPDQGAVARWAEQTPPDFQFCFKVPRTISHDRRLRNAEHELQAFVARLAPLGARLGPSWIQLPPSFGPSGLDALDRFLATLPTAWSWGVEVRNRAFEANGSHERPLNDLLHAHGVERVLIDTRAVFAGPRVTPAEIEAFERKPRLRVRPVALGNRPVVRFIGQTDHRANPPFWRPWVAKVVEWLEEGRSPVVFIHTPDNARAPELAREFHAEVAGLIAVEPMPEPLRAPTQTDLSTRSSADARRWRQSHSCCRCDGRAAHGRLLAVGLFAWIAVGFIAGLVARVVVRPGHRLGCLGTIAVGLAGSLVGGTLANVLAGNGLDLAVSGVLGSALGAVLILALARLRGTDVTR